MKILYISDRNPGGIANHVKCVASCLPSDVEKFVIGLAGNEPFAGKNGHDIREWFQIRRVIREFKPDIVHFHIPNLFMVLYLRIVRLFGLFECSIVCSWHMPTTGRLGWKTRFFFWLLGKDCYYLPVSKATWNGLKKWLPYAKGEVFFNPIRIKEVMVKDEGERRKNAPFIVGMVGRNADQKDWPSFHRVEENVMERSEGERWKVEFLNAGERAECNGREAIAKMDLFLMTSKHEQLPTVVLECFILGTPICGFIPKGGMREILSYSTGALREVFIEERDCDKLAEIVLKVLNDDDLRQRIIEDGWQIVSKHFDAEKNCRGRLMEIYHRVCGRN